MPLFRSRAAATRPAGRAPEPAAAPIANLTSFRRRERSAVEAQVGKALRLAADVPGRVQEGPTCGLYALGMVMDFWDDRDRSHLNPLVQDSDLVRSGSHSRPPDTETRLFDVAKSRGYTTLGGMFDAENLAKLAREFGYQADVKSGATLGDIKACIDRHHPALMAFDADYSGNPGLLGGDGAHWAVIEAYFQKDGDDYLVATHGWKGEEYAWKANDFLASANQLNASDSPDARGDIAESLRGKLVEVSP